MVIVGEFHHVYQIVVEKAVEKVYAWLGCSTL